MSYVIKLNEQQLSFLFNNLESEVNANATSHAWYIMMDTLCWDEEKQVFKPENPLILHKEQKTQFYQDMAIDAEIILHQLEMDVRYHTCNDSSWSNSKWCLEMISDILEVIREAQVI
jgi:hypothetical protein